MCSVPASSPSYPHTDRRGQPGTIRAPFLSPPGKAVFPGPLCPAHLAVRDLPQTSPLQRPAPQGRQGERSAGAAGTTVPQDPPARSERGSGHNLLPRPASGPEPSRAEPRSRPPRALRQARVCGPVARRQRASGREEEEKSP